MSNSISVQSPYQFKNPKNARFARQQQLQQEPVSEEFAAMPSLGREVSNFKPTDFDGMQSMNGLLLSDDALPEVDDTEKNQEEEAPSNSKISSFLNARVTTFMNNMDTIAGMVKLKDNDQKSN
jgi:hypothetical protein